MAKTGFSDGFSDGFGWNSTGQLVIWPGSHPRLEDGDVTHAFNRRTIRHHWAQLICWPRESGKKLGGFLGSSKPLLESFLSKVYQYKFERVSPRFVRRTHLRTLDEDIIGPTANAKGEKMNVPAFLARRHRFGKLPMFGEEGKEVWYGGHTLADHAALDNVWTDIEAQTSHLERNCTRWPWNDTKQYLVIAVDDFDDETAGELTAPLMDGETLVKKHRSWIPWRDLRDTVEADVLNKKQKVDIFGIRKHVRSQIVETKSL
jgi:hypothetical protein